MQSSSSGALYKFITATVNFPVLLVQRLLLPKAALISKRWQA
jgi:hypothetical protein